MEKTPIVITVVSENTVYHHSLLAQHGQSLHIDYSGKAYLFDVAEVFEGFMYNLQQLSLSLDRINSIILSHNHLDHTGSLPKLLHLLHHQSLLLPPDMHLLDDSRYKPTYREIHHQFMTKEATVTRILAYKHSTIIDASKQLAENFYITGPLGDTDKEQSLVITIPGKGLVLLVGCAHPGLPAIIAKAREIANTEKIYGIIGGLHFKDMTPTQIAEQITYLKTTNVDFLVPSHCTGASAVTMLKEAFHEKIKTSWTGAVGAGAKITLWPELQFSFTI